MKQPLPIINGVSPCSQWLPSGSWNTVLDFLLERFPRVEAATWLTRMRKGEVVDETGLRLNPKSPYRVGACIFYYRELDLEEEIPFLEQVLYRDEHILVVDKPHFLPVVPSGRFLQETLLVRLKRKENLDQLVPMHRIDRDTAGIVLFSLNPVTRGIYASLFHNRQVKKVYEALAPTHPSISFPLTRRSRIVQGEPFFRMKEADGTPNSETYIDVIEKRGSVTLYELSPVTGRKHQLRVHMSSLGIPIINDRLYPQIDPAEDSDYDSPLKLLAKSISFQDPVTGEERYFASDRQL